MRNNQKFKMVLTILIVVISFTSCQKEKEFQEKGRSVSKNFVCEKPIVKEFEIKSSWFKTDKHNKAFVVGDIYNNFGLGYDVATNEDRISIFNPGVSIAPLVSTAILDKSDIVYTATTDYQLIENNVASTLSASLKVSTPWVKANSSLSISKSEKITESRNSVYVNVIYIKKYGRGWLEYTAPAMNDFLTYKTNLNTPEVRDGIVFGNSQFRKIFGDRFKYAMTFGVMLVGTIQIVNVDFSKSTREEIEMKAKVSVRNMVEANTSWESEKSNFESFGNSSIVVTATAIPRTSSYIFNRDDLVKQLQYMDQCYSANDLGVIASEYADYSALYPTYNFIKISEVYKSVSAPNKTGSIKILPQNYDPAVMVPLYRIVKTNFLGSKIDYEYSNEMFCFPKPNTLKLNSTLLGYIFKNKVYDDLVELKVYGNSISTDPSKVNWKTVGWVFPQ